MGQLVANDYDVVCDDENLHADTLIINTCGFIGDAKEESVNTILQCIEAKKRGMTKQVFVMGCMTEKYKKRGMTKQVFVMGCMTEKYKDEMLAELPEVDAFFGKFQGKDIVARLGKNYKQDIVKISRKRYCCSFG